MRCFCETLQQQRCHAMYCSHNHPSVAGPQYFQTLLIESHGQTLHDNTPGRMLLLPWLTCAKPSYR